MGKAKRMQMSQNLSYSKWRLSGESQHSAV